MAWKRVLIPIAASGLLHTTAVIAQGPPPGLTMPNARFVNAPQVGEQFPDVTIVDDQGNPVNIRELASQSPYTVLTLGCLT